ncbi:MAG: hypothetical protein A7316_08145 [Candidatus Altiarchaeales archaeon WOR_SM1_86-2]|nr:MAG: hypothetical protein A7316_08145 [Candidatus Altiarchaeales archaeon WOR_SM1_86-2]
MDVIILAAGESRRLKPLTSTRPKPMLHVAGKPMLEWVLEALSGLPERFRISKIVIVIGYKKEIIENYFENKFNGMEIEYVEQERELGTADAVYVARNEVREEEFMVINGDLISSPEFIKDLIKNHEEHNSPASLALKEVENPSQYGVVELKRNIVKSIKEKPEKPKSNLVNAGMYIFRREDIFNSIEEIMQTQTKCGIPDVINKLIPDDLVHGFKCPGLWINVRHPRDLLDANKIILEEGFGSYATGTYIKKNDIVEGPCYLGENTQIEVGAQIEGPCYLGDKCHVGTNCSIGPYTSLGNGVRIGNGVVIENSIIMPKTKIGDSSYIPDSVLGEGCILNKGTKVQKFTESERKLCVILGDGVETGRNVLLMQGISIFPGSKIGVESVIETFRKDKAIEMISAMMDRRKTFISRKYTIRSEKYINAQVALLNTLYENLGK